MGVHYLQLAQVRRLRKCVCLAVLAEALRVYPPVAVGLPRMVDAQDDMIAGYWVPGGVTIRLA